MPAPSSAAPPRLVPLDMLRGLILAIMALDHVSAFVARRHSFEFWGSLWTRYDDWFPFLTRFVTHLCAPGFFLLMGAGMALLADARRRQGWPESRIAGFLLKRGALLLVVNQFLENPAWIIGLLSAARVTDTRQLVEDPFPGDTAPAFLIFGVLTGLGLTMMAASLLMRFGNALLLSLAALAAVVTNAFTPPPEQYAVAFPIWIRLLLIPGQTAPALVAYPLIPWLTPVLLGIVLARLLVKDARKVYRLAVPIGLALCALALLVRAAGTFGNLRLPRDGSAIEFLNFIKYPPALVFLLFMLGLNLVLLKVMELAERSPLARPLATFGSVPLCYYLAHLYLYAIIGALLFRSGAPLAIAYPVWLAGLVPLYFICRWYRGFKQKKPPESLWRFF